jgi:1-acyl-sn-glycerol-3-phosphate acyltransferase
LVLMMVLLACYVVFYIVVSPWRRFDLRWNLRLRSSWIRLALKIVGLDPVMKGEIPLGNFIYVCNHRSFFDPVIVLHFIDALPLSKAEVKGYPLIGYSARITGVLFVNRDSQSSRQEARSAIAKTIRDGHSVLVFPEGTVVVTDVSGEFKKGTFIEAANQGIGIVPVALEYRDPEDRWKDLSLFRQYIKQFRKRRSECICQFGSPLYSSDHNYLRNTAKVWIDQTLIRIQANWKIN